MRILIRLLTGLLLIMVVACSNTIDTFIIEKKVDQFAPYANQNYKFEAVSVKNNYSKAIENVLTIRLNQIPLVLAYQSHSDYKVSFIDGMSFGLYPTLEIKIVKTSNNKNTNVDQIVYLAKIYSNTNDNKRAIASMTYLIAQDLYNRSYNLGTTKVNYPFEDLLKNIQQLRVINEQNEDKNKENMSKIEKKEKQQQNMKEYNLFTKNSHK